MPQIRIDYTNNLALPDDNTQFIKQIHHIVQRTVQPSWDSIKTQLHAIDDFYVGKLDGEQPSMQGFFLLHIQIMQGRNAQQKQELIQQLLDYLRQQLAQINQDIHTQLRVKLDEIDASQYGCDEIDASQYGCDEISVK